MTKIDIISFYQYVIESRKNPEVNSKTNNALEDIADIIDKYNYDESYCMIRAHEYEIVNINPAFTYDTPLGIYGYPYSYIKDVKTSIKLPLGSKSRYISLVIIKKSANLVTLNTLSNNEYNKYKSLTETIISTKYNVHDYEFKDYSDNGKNLYYNIRDVSKLIRPNGKTPIIEREIYKSIGIDGLIDNGGGIIHYNEPSQMVIFDRKFIDKLYTVYNKSELRRKIEHQDKPSQHTNKFSEISKDTINNAIERAISGYSDILIINNDKINIFNIQDMIDLTHTKMYNNLLAHILFMDDDGNYFIKLIKSINNDKRIQFIDLLDVFEEYDYRFKYNNIHEKNKTIQKLYRQYRDYVDN